MINYFLQSPFLIYVCIITGFLIGRAARELDKSEGRKHYVYYITLVGDCVGISGIMLSSAFLSVVKHWYYPLLAIAGLLVGIITPFILTSPLNAFSDIIERHSEKSYNHLQMTLYYATSVVIQSIGIYALLHYLVYL